MSSSKMQWNILKAQKSRKKLTTPGRSSPLFLPGGQQLTPIGNVQQRARAWVAANAGSIGVYLSKSVCTVYTQGHLDGATYSFLLTISRVNTINEISPLCK